MNDLFEKYGLDRVVNACGSFTPLGVSRSPAAVRAAAAETLGHYFIIEQLQAVASKAIASRCGAEAAAVTHCASAGITIGLAGLLTGDDPKAVQGLPDAMPDPTRVVIPGPHVVNYGHEITQDIRLCGASPLTAGNDQSCSLEDLEETLSESSVGCLLLVCSRLTRDPSLDLSDAVELAHRHNIPVLIDGAAQDLRMEALVACEAELVVFSAHKYLASATAGLIVGQSEAVKAASAHQYGIGRGMKPSKEAIMTVLAALEERDAFDADEWLYQQSRKIGDFVTVANRIDGIRASTQADPAGIPIHRVVLDVDPMQFGIPASMLAEALCNWTPPVYVMTHEVDEGKLILEIHTLERHELATVLEAIRDSSRN